MNLSERFNRSRFGCWINRPSGRAFRLCAGIVFLAIGIRFREHPWGIAALVWSFIPLSAGIFNVCWISLCLGGPFRGARIRQLQRGSGSGNVPT